ncbi:MAG: M3 family oligoendopeptidase [Nitrospiraceae bacterium]
MPVTRIKSSVAAAPARRRLRAYADRWNLTDLLPHGIKDFQPTLADLERRVSEFEASRTRLSATMAPAEFLALLDQEEQISRLSSTLGAHSYLWYSENTAHAPSRSHKALVEERLTGIHNRLLFFDLWWQSLDEPTAQRFIDAAPRYRYHLETIRRFTPHTLSEAEEKVLNVKNTTGRTAITTLYDLVTNGLSFTLTVKGKKKTMTREELSSYVRCPNSKLREAAYNEMHRVFGGHRDTLGEMYKALVTDWKAEQVGLRHFDSPIHSRNVQNDIPDEAVGALLDACLKNATLFQRYFKVKAKVCGIHDMSRYHIYAPFRGTEKAYAYQDAVKLVLDSYRGFSPKLADLAEQVFAERHVHATTQPGKVGGAYCYSITPGTTPYVLLNYTGDARDIATMAHELGHAVHGMLAAEHPVFTFHSTLPLAETASVFGERILSDALLQQERNTKVKQGILLGQLDDIYATVMRQAYFVQFERTAHEAIANGATVEDLSQTYGKLLKQQFGKAVRVPDAFNWEWITIPHIYHTPFYCYAYSFGNLLVLALYGMYRQQGEAFVPKYLQMLATGGSQSPTAILESMGVDMRAPSFWQAGFDMVKEMVDELERTAAR